MVYTGTSNIMEGRAVSAIALRESNLNGGFYFMSLETDQRIHANKWTELHITDIVVHKVHQLAEIEGTNHNLKSPIDISYEFAHGDQTNRKDIIDKRVTFAEDPQDIDERIDLAINHLNQSDSNDTEHSSDTTATDDDDSTYVSSDQSNPDESDIKETVNQCDATEINSEDFIFNIANVYESDVEE